ncbi:MAG: helix-turn-helix domain-containing protein [Marinibacterium sp.]|nr:helix-turn-helix domain-containing protein [Marinibacterium sp.]
MAQHPAPATSATPPAPNAPLRLIEARFGDLEQLCHDVRQWDLDFTPVARLTDQPEVGRIAQTSYGLLEMSKARFNTPLHQFGAPPPLRATFVVMEPTVQRHWWRGHDVGVDTVLITPPGGDFESFSAPGFEFHTVSIGTATLAETAARLELVTPAPTQWPEAIRLPPGAARGLRHLLRRLNAGLGDAQDVDDAICHLTALWCRPADPRRATPARLRDGAMRRCLEAIAATDEPLGDATQLRHIAGVSERTLQYAFRERFGLSPAAFLKLHRLGHLRRALHRADPDHARVGDLAAQLGFWHGGHLSTDYRRAFGETPADTLARRPH